MLLSVKLFFAFCLLVHCSVSAQADEPKVTLAIPYPIDRLTHFDAFEPVHRIMYESSSIGLMTHNEQGNVVLGAANGFEIRNDSKEWVFELPENLRLISGRILRGEDIQASVAYLKARSSGMSASLENLMRVHSSHSGREVTFELKNPDRDFSSVLASMPILDASIIKGFSNDYGIGTQFSFLGAYHVIENRGGEGFVLGAVPELYELKPHRNARIVFRYFPKDQRVLRKLVYGLVDIIPLPTEQQLLEARKDPRFLVLPSPFRKLEPNGNSWLLRKTHWGDEETEGTRLSTEYIIVRDSFSLTPAALNRFDLANVSVSGKTPLP